MTDSLQAHRSTTRRSARPSGPLAVLVVLMAVGGVWGAAGCEEIAAVDESLIPEETGDGGADAAEAGEAGPADAAEERVDDGRSGPGGEKG